MKTVEMQKLPCLENKTNHEMEKKQNEDFVSTVSRGGGKGLCWRTELK